MKRVAAVIFAGLLACISVFALAGCSGKSNDMTGTWVCVAIEVDGSIIEVADYEELLGMTGEELATLKLSADGSCDFVVTGESLFSANGVEIGWEKTDNGVTLIEKSSGESSFELPYDSSTGRLQMEYEGESIYFELK